MASREVTKEEFFAAIGQLNVHPRAERDASYWELPNRQLFGISKPGYLDPGAPKQWLLTQPA